MNNLWYKNAIIYSLDIESFLDSDGDGIGDFKGLKHRLNYLSSLGVNCVWLLPFYETPNRDNGYDVKDYYQVDSRLGDLGHFAEFVEAAEEFGIRVIIDLVLNHTSDQHFWFQDARKSKDSPFRDFYIWSEQKPENDDKYVIFGEKQGNSNWKYDDVAGAYFYHTFYEHQPDLNLTNPAVRKEIKRIMHFWLKLGVSGFRIDAAPHMIREKGSQKFKDDPHEVFRDFRDFVQTHKEDAVLLAEVDVEPERYQDFFGDEDQMTLLFNFYLNNYLWLAFAQKKAAPLEKALKGLPRNQKKEQLANFLRNHDELDLERLTKKEREEVLKVFAPDENMRIYGRGIRRRVAPMLENTRKQMELAYSLLFTLPGTPVLRYGQEIGMGDDLSLPERESVRTLMQWSADKNGGFSSAAPGNLVRNIISKGEFSYKKVNVSDQHRDPDSFLNWIARAINMRRETSEFGFGDYEVIKTGDPEVFAHLRRSDRGLGLAVHNLGDKEKRIRLELEDTRDIVDIFGDQKYEDFDPGKQEVKLSPYGYRWLRKRQIIL